MRNPPKRTDFAHTSRTAFLTCWIRHNSLPIQSDNFDSKHFDEVNQFIEDYYEYFYGNGWMDLN